MSRAGSAFLLYRAAASILVLAWLTAPLRAQSTPADVSSRPGEWPAEAVRQLLRREARTFRGRDVLRVEALEAERSRAWRELAGAEDVATDAAVAPLGGYWVHARVTVRTAAPQRLAAWAARRGLAVRMSPAAAGFYRVEAGTVQTALEAAEALSEQAWVEEAYVDLTQPTVLREIPDDVLLESQWHLYHAQNPGVDARVFPVWAAGITGQGVVIGIVEPSAWQLDHPDLAGAFHALASQPGGAVSAHATSTAGIAAAVGGNGIYGAGVAFRAQLSTQRIGSDEEVAEALAYRNDLNGIKNNSWGPPDDALLRKLPSVVAAALEEGVRSGRGGLGTVFVWAAGNGGGESDRVDYDPYASSRYTIAVNAVTDQDIRAVYDEKGSCVLLCAYSSGGTKSIRTTTWNSGWTTTFGGTSAAAPLVSGVVALMLEANPLLTWRDVQHVLVESARQVAPDDSGWELNGAGRPVHYHYGFGVVDASAAVPLAQSWRNVPREITADTGVVPVQVDLPDNDPTGVTVDVDVPDGVRIESVELVLNVQTNRVGDLRIVLTAPSGLSSIFAHTRMDPQDHLVDHVFTSVRHWGERSGGVWSVKLSDLRENNIATWQDLRLIVYGTPACPGDLDGSGSVELSDVMTLLVGYGTCVGDPLFIPEADLDNSGCNDLADLSRLLEAFGGACE